MSVRTSGAVSVSKILVPLVIIGALALMLMPIIFENQNSPRSDFTELEYRLKWLANPGFIGDIYADAYGLYRAEGLNVTVEPGGPNRDPIAALETGQAQFGVASADQVLNALYKGSDLVVLAQIYRKNPVQWIYRTNDHTIDRASDLSGKRVGITHGDNDQTIMEALLKKNALEKVDLIGVRFDYTPFLLKTVDLFPVYVNTQGVDLSWELEKNDEEVGSFDPGGPEGINFVANSLITTSKIANSDRELAQKYVPAPHLGRPRQT